MPSLTELKTSLTTIELSVPPTTSNSAGATTSDTTNTTNTAAAAAAVTAAASSAASAAAVAASSAMSRVASAIPSPDSLKDRLIDVWTRSRPWSEFLNTAQINKPEPADLLERVKQNLEYYAFNYLVILLVLSALTIITSPLAFLGGLFIVAAYLYLYFLNPEPFVVAGVALDRNVKAALITVFSLIVLWLTRAGTTFTGLIFVVAAISLTHAALRKPHGEADFDTAYTPATV